MHHIRRGSLFHFRERRLLDQHGKRLRRWLQLPDVIKVKQEIVRSSDCRLRLWLRSMVIDHARAVCFLPRATNQPVGLVIESLRRSAAATVFPDLDLVLRDDRAFGTTTLLQVDETVPDLVCLSGSGLVGNTGTLQQVSCSDVT